MTQSKTETMLTPRNIRQIKYFSFSVALLCLSTFIFIVDPLERLIDSQLEIRKGTFLYYLWEKPPLPVILQVFIFNITNAEEFLSGKDRKLKVIEIGPYVYQEFLENKNATFHENGTLSFVPERHSIFLPERSIGDPHKDVIVAANLPLLGLSSAAAGISTLAALAFSTFAKSTGAQPLLNITVHDYLWGYHDKFVSLAHSVLPGHINFDKFGLLDRLFDEGHNLVSMNLPKAVEIIKRKKEIEIMNEPVSLAQISNQIIDFEYEESSSTQFNDISQMSLQIEDKIVKKAPEIRDYSIDLFNGSPGLRHWGFDESEPESNSPCNTLQGAYDGTLFPKNISQNEKFKVYRKAFCRTLPIHYSHSGKQYGIDAYWFEMSSNAFDDSLDDPETMCFCSKERTCLKRGLGNISPCYYNIPASVSLPHFYNSDPTLLNEVEGLKPEKDKHESIIVMQPRLGVPIKVQTRIQLNLMNGETKFNSKVKRFDHITLPVFWVELAVEDLTPFLHFTLHMAFKVLPVVQIITTVISMLFGFFFLASAFGGAVFIIAMPSRRLTSNKSIKYTAVFPYLKREIAKFEDRECELV